MLTLIVLFLMISNISKSQTPPHPASNGNGANVGGPVVGGSAPIDGGLSIFLILGSIYSIRKKLNRNNK